MTVAERIVSSVGTLGENIVLRRATVAHTDSGLIGVATHGGTATAGRLAALLRVDVKGADEKLLQAADPVVTKVGSCCIAFGAVFCLLSFCCSPPLVTSSQVAKHVIGMNPASIADLLQQDFIFDSKVKVGELLEKEGKRLGIQLSVVEMVRVACGESAPKKD